MATPRTIKKIDVDAGLLAEARGAMSPAAAEAADAEVVERALRLSPPPGTGDLAGDEHPLRRGCHERRLRRVARDETRAAQRRVRRVVIDPGVLVSAFISPKKAAPVLLVTPSSTATSTCSYRRC